MPAKYQLVSKCRDIMVQCFEVEVDVEGVGCSGGGELIIVDGPMWDGEGPEVPCVAECRALYPGLPTHFEDEGTLLVPATTPSSCAFGDMDAQGFPAAVAIRRVCERTYRGLAPLAALRTVGVAGPGSVQTKGLFVRTPMSGTLVQVAT
jgi:hypothetical protein